VRAFPLVDWLDATPQESGRTWRRTFSPAITAGSLASAYSAVPFPPITLARFRQDDGNFG
jgi:hypothetical protein